MLDLEGHRFKMQNRGFMFFVLDAQGREECGPKEGCKGTGFCSALLSSGLSVVFRLAGRLFRKEKQAGQAGDDFQGTYYVCSTGYCQCDMSDKATNLVENEKECPMWKKEAANNVQTRQYTAGWKRDVRYDDYGPGSSRSINVPMRDDLKGSVLLPYVVSPRPKL